jgi:hypothetical protein
LPIINNAGTINPIINPEIYQGHGCFNNSIICLLLNQSLS